MLRVVHDTDVNMTRRPPRSWSTVSGLRVRIWMSCAGWRHGR
jgi:hypothetical protein